MVPPQASPARTRTAHGYHPRQFPGRTTGSTESVDASSRGPVRGYRRPDPVEPRSTEHPPTSSDVGRELLRRRQSVNHLMGACSRRRHRPPPRGGQAAARKPTAPGSQAAASPVDRLPVDRCGDPGHPGARDGDRWRRSRSFDLPASGQATLTGAESRTAAPMSSAIEQLESAGDQSSPAEPAKEGHRHPRGARRRSTPLYTSASAHRRHRRRRPGRRRAVRTRRPPRPRREATTGMPPPRRR